MKIDSSEISALIKAQIQGYESRLETDDVGTVISVGDGIALCYGLDKAMLGELLVFPNDIVGMVMNLDNEDVGAVLLGSDTQIEEGDTVKRTHRVVEVPVGDGLLGRVVNALGAPIDEKGPITYTKTRPIERIAPGVMTRKSVDTPLETGIKAIDAMIPIGRGQRELIIGDRQTGKSALCIDTIINQKGKNVICVYVAIGQKSSTIRKVVDDLTRYGAMDYTVVVAATAAQSASLQYLAPYTGTAIAEEFMYRGRDCLIVYDDLSKHAVAYRTISLLLKRPSGREAYPGDIFYLHSRLLERSAHLSADLGGGSLTALPVVETLSGDIAAYIPTNVISITDGQIYLESELFHAGVRPAINVGLSVSRVGSAAQCAAIKTVSKQIRLNLAHYREMVLFARFGADLDAKTKAILARGERLTESLKQPRYRTKTVCDMTVELYVVMHQSLLNKLATDKVQPYIEALLETLHTEKPEMMAQIEATEDFDMEAMDTVESYAQRVLERFNA